MSTRMHIVVDDELLARIDQAKHEDQSRGAFVRRCVERELAAHGPFELESKPTPKVPEVPPKPQGRKAQPAHPSVPRPVKRKIEMPEIEQTVTMAKASSMPQPSVWVCSTCGWEKRAHTPRPCPDHGIAAMTEGKG